MSNEVLDNFEDVSGWSAIASGQARLDISQDQGPRGIVDEDRPGSRRGLRQGRGRSEQGGEEDEARHGRSFPEHQGS